MLRLHRGDVPPEDREIIFGVPVTNAMRTILDVRAEGSLPPNNRIMKFGTEYVDSTMAAYKFRY